jgi:hypothetical protein
MKTKAQVLPGSVLKMLQSVGLHPGYYDTEEKAAAAVVDLVKTLRKRLNDPDHNTQCMTLQKLGVEGYTGDEPPTCKIVSLSQNAKD